MTSTIEIDDDLLDFLKRHAEPFVDTPNDVLRRLLFGTSDGEAAQRQPSEANRARTGRPSRRRTVVKRDASPSRRTGARRRRVPSSSLLPEQAYELPILSVLAEADGRLPTREAVAAVGDLVESQLLPADREIVEGGRPRWEMRVQFSRLRLVEAGLMKKDSPRGVWEISDAGRSRLETASVAA